MSRHDPPTANNCTIYIGNMHYETVEADLIHFLHPRRTKRITIPMDKDTGRPRGFGFVEFETEADALSAVQDLDNTEFGGRTVKISIAKPRENNRNGGGRDRNDNRSRQQRR